VARLRIRDGGVDRRPLAINALLVSASWPIGRQRPALRSLAAGATAFTIVSVVLLWRLRPCSWAWPSCRCRGCSSSRCRQRSLGAEPNLDGIPTTVVPAFDGGLADNADVQRMIRAALERGVDLEGGWLERATTSSAAKTSRRWRRSGSADGAGPAKEW
jgi:hypothetical protein